MFIYLDYNSPAMKGTIEQLYEDQYVVRGFERLALLRTLAQRYAIASMLYPGSFVHITPSFVYPVTVYVDTDRRAKQFFADPTLATFINQRKLYDQEASVTFHAADYRTGIAEAERRFDLLISQYAGFICQPCKRYLKVGGWLLVNNSHGDASIASLDDDYALVAAIHERNGKVQLIERNLEEYFVPKSGLTVTKAQIEQLGRGIAYKKSGSAYVFQRVR